MEKNQEVSFDYKIFRSKRKTVAIEITSEGCVIVKAPKGLGEEKILSFVLEKQDWIEKHLEKMQLRIEESARVEPLTQEELLQLKLQAKEYFSNQCKIYANKMQVNYGNISFRFQHKRWGSCSSKGNLNFNVLLMLAPEEIRDYVIVHELSHRIQMNHSKEFWNIVKQYDLNFKEHEKWLKLNGHLLQARLKEVEKKKYYTYMLQCNDKSYYIGYTNDLEKRLQAHNEGKGAKYTKVRRPVSLVYWEEYDTKEKAMSREVLLKQLTRVQKQKLIKSFSK